MIFEPLLMGAGGMLMYEPEALDALIACCRRHGVLTIADEVMTGFGRTGKLFACDHLQHPPDLICLAKGLTGGTLPLAVTACTAEVFAAFYSDDKKHTFFHGHSFTANPLGCAAALASLELLLSDFTRRQISEISRRHQDFVRQFSGHRALADIRARGTVLALEFRTDAATSYFNELRDQLYAFFLERDVILRPLGNVVYVMPPYCITEEQLARVYSVLEEAVELYGRR